MCAQESNVDEHGSSLCVTDAALVAASLKGSEDAFAVLMNRYNRKIYRRVYAITRNREDAEDAVQEAFLRAYSNLAQFEGRAVFYSWLTRIAINCALMLLRKRSRSQEMPLDVYLDGEGESVELAIRDMSPGPEQIYLFHREVEQVLSSIRKLPHALRRVAQMRIVYEQSTEMVATRMGTTPTAIKARLHRARRYLAEAQ